MEMHFSTKKLFPVFAALTLQVNGNDIPSKSARQVESAGDTWPWQTFKSSNFTPPFFNISGNGGALDPNHLFLTPSNNGTSNGTKASYPIIVDNEGELVFALNISGTTDLRMQVYEGKPHLTFWSGINTNGANVGHGFGHVNFYDQQYSNFTLSPNININALQPTPDGVVDLHEHQIVQEGSTILVTAFNNTPADLSKFGIKNGWVVDSIVSEVDVKSGEILFTWNPAHHGVSYNLSKVPVGTPDSGNGTASSPWDWCHINSATKVGKNYLINSRHLWTVWLVDGNDGSVIWALNGGNGGDFGAFPNGSTFSWQHHVRAHNVSDRDITLSLFDNHNNVALVEDSGPTNALVLKLALPPQKDVSPLVLRNISVPSQPLYAGSQGSFLPELSNGNALVGYGQVSVAREFGPVTGGQNQRLLREWRFGQIDAVQSYRAFKMPWHATPAHWDPSLVVEKPITGEVHAFVSWNGATNITDWNVSAGSERSRLDYIGVAKKRGFETTFTIDAKYKCVRVTASSHGKQIRNSNIACISI